jgi:purine-binding chemotaxis protein CheW
VVEVRLANEPISIGIVVDAVSEVSQIKEEELEATPSFGTSLDTSYILGMAKTDNSVKILLDIDQVLTQEELASLERAF